MIFIEIEIYTCFFLIPFPSFPLPFLSTLASFLSPSLPFPFPSFQPGKEAIPKVASFLSPSLPFNPEKRQYPRLLLSYPLPFLSTRKRGNTQGCFFLIPFPSFQPGIEAIPKVKMNLCKYSR
jgi:hypothetical protein